MKDWYREKKGCGARGVKDPGIRGEYSCFAYSCSLRAVCDFRGGSRGLSTTREGTERVRGVADGAKVEGGLEEAWYARAVVWMRGLEFDPAGKTEMKGMRWRRESRRGYQW